MSNYRYDQRSEEQFKEDIKNLTLEERALFLAWLDLIEKETGHRPIYKDTGCGKDGELLTDAEVTTAPDFEVEGYGKVEVKFSRPKLDHWFHLKANQVNQYLKAGATILMVNGSKEENPDFTMLKNDALQRIVDSCEQIIWRGFGAKLAYRIPVNMFIWRKLK